MPLAKGNAFAGNLPNPYHDKIDFTKPGAQEYIDLDRCALLFLGVSISSSSTLLRRALT